MVEKLKEEQSSKLYRKCYFKEKVKRKVVKKRSKHLFYLV